MSDRSQVAVLPRRRRADRAVELAVDPAYRAAFLLLLVVVACGVFEPNVLAPANLRIVLTQSVPVAAIALGTMLVLLTGAIDLSVGAVTSLCAVVLALSLAADEGLAVGIAKALAVGAVAGGLNALLVGALRLPAFVVTLGTLTAAGGVTIMMSGDISLGAHRLSDIARTSIAGVRADILFIVALGMFLHLLVTRSGFGVAMRGVGSDEHSSALLGLSASRVRAAAFIMSGLLAAVTAVLLVARTPVVTPQLGGSLLLDAFAAAVIGGTSIFGGRGSAVGTILGAVLIAFIGNFLIHAGVTPSSLDFYRGSIILLALLGDALMSKIERARALRI